ncbi:MAG: hypothetical protein GXY19_20395 [Phycisphaerae bacterium]|nr:hypothetical protein [Phycisphaerae bacterium]
MARKKQRISLSERFSSWWGTRTKREAQARKQTLTTAVKVAAVMFVLVAAGAFLRYAEGYVGAARPTEEGRLVLVGVPAWANWDLKARVVAAAGGDRFPVQEETAEVVARNLAQMSWLDDVSVHVTYDSVCVQARWRKPVALIERGPSKFYVDADLVVLDYMPMAHLPIVKVEGVSQGLPPSPGALFDRDDLAAAVKLIILLNRMDAEVTPKSPLLEQIANIDVTNYKGRRNHRDPHIVLNSKDGTLIYWGAEIGEWAKHLEAKDEQKLAKLYTYYKESGSLSAGVKYINLYDPQDKVPQPIDKYR